MCVCSAVYGAGGANLGGSSPRSLRLALDGIIPTGLWPMMRPGAVLGATRALRGRVWHEVRVDERTVR
eukprot:4659820-Prymnesium_polylepis.1